MEEEVGWQILWPGIMWSKLKIETFGLKSTCRNGGGGIPENGPRENILAKERTKGQTLSKGRRPMDLMKTEVRIGIVRPRAG